MRAKKVVLVASQPYDSFKFDALLSSLIERRIALFCASGVDAENWEEAFDWLVVDHSISASDGYSPLTSSHPDESEAEVLEFAKNICREFGDAVDLLRV